MKIWMVVIISLLISYSCFAMYFGIPRKDKKIKYVLDFSKLETLKENSFNDEFLKEILENMENIKFEERKLKWSNGDNYTNYYFIDENEKSDLRIEILPKRSTKEAIEYFERYKSENRSNKILYKNKENSKTRYYGTYMNQWRTDPEGGSKLMNKYTTYLGIQSGSIFIQMIDFNSSKDKKKIQKYIDMFVEVAEKYNKE